MALPVLNVSPKYELTVPSTKKKVKFRPFLVKEQKVLLIAYESQDKKQILQAIIDTIKACVEGLENDELATFDVDYLFTQIRAKSVGEKVNVEIACEHCGILNPVEINLEDVKIEVEESSKVVKINDEISLKLKYPNYSQFLANQNFFEATSQSEMLMEIVYSCIESIMTEEENIRVIDEPREEIEKFVESLSSKQFEEISAFVQAMPQLKHQVDINCSSCGKESIRILEGIDDFF